MEIYDNQVFGQHHAHQNGLQLLLLSHSLCQLMAFQHHRQLTRKNQLQLSHGCWESAIPVLNDRFILLRYFKYAPYFSLGKKNLYIHMN